MTRYTNVMMGVICYIVKKAPILFTERIRLASQVYYHNRNAVENNTYVQMTDRITQYSLLSPQYKWTFTGVRHLRPLSMSDAVKSIRWRERNKIWKTQRIEVNPISSREINLDRLFFQDSFDGQRISTNLRANTNSKWVSHCFISVIELKSGYYFLSTHWYLTDKAAELLQCVSVEDIPLSSVNYETSNPFRHNFSAASLPSRLNKSKDRLVGNIDRLHKELGRLGEVVNAHLGIKKEQAGVYTLDAYNNSDHTYFDLDLSGPFRGNSVTDRHLIDTSINSPVLIMGEKGDKEFLITSSTLRRAKIPYLAIYSVPDEGVLANLTNIPRDKQAVSIEDSVHIFQLLFLLRMRFDAMVASHREVIVTGLSRPGKNYSRLYDANIEAVDIVRQAEILQSDESLYLFRVRDKFTVRMKELVARHLKDFRSISEDIDLKKHICSEKVSAENLVYQRKMTYLVVFLAALQVIIAAASIQELKEVWMAFWRTLTL